MEEKEKRIIIRKARASDLSGLMRLERAFPEGERDEKSAYAGRLESESHAFWVAEIEGEIAGHLLVARWPADWRPTARGYRLGDTAPAGDGGAAFIESLCSAPAFRRQGVAKALLRAAFGEPGQERGAIVGAIKADNEPALALARSRGRSAALEREGYFPEAPFKRVVFMAKEAAASPAQAPGAPILTGGASAALGSEVK